MKISIFWASNNAEKHVAVGLLMKYDISKYQLQNKHLELFPPIFKPNSTGMEVCQQN
jgi:hypothetical protein